MKVLTASEMKRVDEYAIKKLGIPGTTLMENAGIAVVEVISELFQGKVKGKPIHIFCGPGNNGGDGFVIARHLANMGADICVFLVGNSVPKGDAAINKEIFEKLNGKTERIASPRDIRAKIPKYSKPVLIVDAIFGTGLERDVTGIFSKVIDHINRSGAKVIAVDIPSGLHSDKGLPLKNAVKADITVTFGFAKLGLIIGESSDYVGDLIIKDISLPKILPAGIGAINMIDTKMVTSLFKPRKALSHKGTYGHVLIVAGSKEKSGAAKLAAVSALRTGAGLVTLAVPKSAHDVIKSSLFNVMSIPVEDEGGAFTEKGIKKILDAAKDKDAVAVGPGLIKCREVGDLIIHLIKKTRIPLIVDADGLNSIASRMREIGKGRDKVVFTPHPGEMSRLLDVKTEAIQKDRIGTVKDFASKYGICVVLKGYRSLIGFRDGSIYINPTGNPGMATAGMGDVLTGMAATYIAQKNFRKAVLSAVFNHGLLGDLVAVETGERGVLASDLVNKIVSIQKTIYPSRKLGRIEEL